jgi:hypothetical protein
VSRPRLLRWQAEQFYKISGWCLTQHEIFVESTNHDAVRFRIIYVDWGLYSSAQRWGLDTYLNEDIGVCRHYYGDYPFRSPRAFLHSGAVWSIKWNLWQPVAHAVQWSNANIWKMLTTSPESSCFLSPITKTNKLMPFRVRDDTATWLTFKLCVVNVIRHHVYLGSRSEINYRVSLCSSIASRVGNAINLWIIWHWSWG